MCGIAGCYGGNDFKTVDRMPDALPRRGPGDCGIHTQLGAIGIWPGFDFAEEREKIQGAI